MADAGAPGKPTATFAAPLLSSDIAELVARPDAIALVGQPIVDLRRGAVVGYEMLSRFSLASGKPAPPDLAFSAAEFAGLGVDLEVAVVARALGVARGVPADCFVTINVDPWHLTEPRVLETIGAHGDLGGIVFELTEHRALPDLAALRGVVERLRSRGAMIALDDAGAGHSGLKQLLEIKPQFVKLDRALVSDVHRDEAKRTLVHMLGELAARLDAWLLAEGIETEGELHALLQLGVPLAQGYFLARPAPPWTSLSVPAADAIRRGARPSEPSSSAATLACLAEPVALVRREDAWPPEAPIAVRLDAHGRPIAARLVTADGARVRLEHDLLRMNAETPVAAAAARSMARHETNRWEPVVCIDERGNLVGVVTMQRIVGALVSHRET